MPPTIEKQKIIETCKTIMSALVRGLKSRNAPATLERFYRCASSDDPPSGLQTMQFIEGFAPNVNII